MNILEMKRSKSLNNLEGLDDVGKYKLNLVLDLDNTIIYTHIFNLETQKDLIKNYLDKDKKRLLISFEKDNYYYFVYERMYLNYFTMYISNYFNIYTYTNGQKFYHDIVINALKDKYPMFQIINSMYKTSYDDSNLKNLEKLDIISVYGKNNLPYELNTLIIDDREDIWPFDRENLIKISPFYNLDIADDDLLFLTDILELLKLEYDKITKIKKKFSIQVLINKLKSFYNI
jgi:TFIIF-interacting CTD phosphatase-like protein